jgi:hypothetical protein
MVIAGLKRNIRVIEIPVNYRSRVGESKITGNISGAMRTGMRMVWLIIWKRFFSPREAGERAEKIIRGA